MASDMISAEMWKSLADAFSQALRDEGFKDDARVLTTKPFDLSLSCMLGGVWRRRSIYAGTECFISSARPKRVGGLLLRVQMVPVPTNLRGQKFQYAEIDLTAASAAFGEEFDNFWFDVMGATVEDTLKRLRGEITVERVVEAKEIEVVASLYADDPEYGSW